MPDISKRIFKSLKIKKAVEKGNYTLAYQLLDTIVLRETKGELSDFIIQKGLNPLDYFRGAVPAYAFYKSKLVDSLEITSDIHIIGEYAFAKSSIKEISLPSGVMVYSNSFLNSSLESIALFGDTKQKDANKVRDSFLTFAPNLKEAYISGRETGRWLSNCKSLKAVTICEGTQKVSSHAFSGCAMLEYAYLPDSVYHLGSYSFNGCLSLKDIVLSEGIRRIGDEIFTDCTPNVNQFQNGYYLATKYNPFFYLLKVEDTYGELVLHEACKVIDGNALKKATITFVELPEGLCAIGGGAFMEQKITSIRIPNQVKTINDCTFLDCKELEEVIMPHPEYIGTKAFMDCVSLSNVAYSDELYENSGQGLIKDYAFYGCRLLESFEIGENMNRIYSNVFRECESLTSIRIPKAVKVLGHRAFYNCKRLEEILFESKNIEIVDETVFEGTLIKKFKYI